MKQVAVIGAGLAGVAVAWHLLNQTHLNVQVTLYDAHGIGGGASGIAAGLMAAFGGARANPLPYGQEGLQATLNLVQIAEATLHKPLLHCGVLRPALTEKQRNDFRKRVETFPEQLHWWSEQECQTELPQLSKAPGLWLPQAYQIDTSNYLKGLWKACEERGAQFILKRVQNWTELKRYDWMIGAMGAESLIFPELDKLAVKRNKGQMVGFSQLPGIDSLPFALNSHAYLVSALDHTFFWAGATYEHDEPLDCQPNLSNAWKLLLPRLEPMLPLLKESTPSVCLTGLRLSTADYLPIMKQLDAKRWVLTGFGSKGLLYHALYGQQLTNKIISAN